MSVDTSKVSAENNMFDFSGFKLKKLLMCEKKTVFLDNSIP